MNITTVKSIFQLFSGEEDTEKYLPIIELAVEETEEMLVENVDADDFRLNFLAAAIANFRLQQINASQDRSTSVYAGKMLTSRSDSGTLGYAEKLMKDYMELCSELINKQTFAFMSFS